MLDMATIVPMSPYWANPAEEKVAASISKMFPSDAILYVHRFIEGRETDLILFLPEKGFVVIEIKDWKSKKIKIVDSNNIIYMTENGEICFPSPINQVNGYRYNLIDFLKKNGISAAVVPVVFYPSITKEEFSQARLDLVSPEKFSACCEELDDASLFFKLIQELFAIASNHIKPLSDKDIRKVRLFFETEEQIKLSMENIKSKSLVDFKILNTTTKNNNNIYSVLCFTNDENLIKDLLDGWSSGCKTILVSEKDVVLQSAAQQLETLLKERGLSERKHFELVRKDSGECSTFHFSSFKVSKDSIKELSIINGNNEVVEANQSYLKYIAESTDFNFDQYLVEHAPLDRNIVVRAGAGTGKTYSMISRIAFLLFAHQWNAELFTKSVIMLTFTNNSAETMNKKMLEYFQDLFLLTKNSIYIKIIEQISNMQISTIHSLAKDLLSKYSYKIGFGRKLSIVSYQYESRRLIEECVNKYLKSYDMSELDIDMYLLIDRLQKMSELLQGRSIDILNDNIDYGNADCQNIGQIVKNVLNEAEILIRKNLSENNKIRVGDIMLKLKQIITNNTDCSPLEGVRYIFVDEFQDTDDVQIDLLKRIKDACGCSLFVVGDVKQCIYRFRGAQEQAFERLMESNWKEFSLRKNYRTDKVLLKEFEKVFSKWGSENYELIPYLSKKDSLQGVKSYPGVQRSGMSAISVKNTEDAKEQLLRIFKEHKEGTLAVLVRENWEVRQIREIAQEKGIYVYADVGGGLYQSEPALDFFRLVLAMQHPNDPKYLFNLYQTSYLDGSLPLEAVLECKKQTKCLLDLFYKNVKPEWRRWCKELEREPVLKVLRSVIRECEPWKNYAKILNEEKYKTREEYFYKNILDQLYEHLFDIANTEYLTVNKLAHFLQVMITTGQSRELREPRFLDDGSRCSIHCSTVHKVKGLEYDTVLLFNTYKNLDRTGNKGDVDVVIVEDKNDKLYKIGYRISSYVNGSSSKNYYCNDYYKNEIDTENIARKQEEARILYVALTRAKKQFLFFEYKDEKKISLTWQNLIKGEYVNGN